MEVVLKNLAGMVGMENDTFSFNSPIFTLCKYLYAVQNISMVVPIMVSIGSS